MASSCSAKKYHGRDSHNCPAHSLDCALWHTSNHYHRPRRAIRIQSLQGIGTVHWIEQNQNISLPSSLERHHRALASDFQSALANRTSHGQHFIEKHRTVMRSLRPTPTSHHVKTRLFRIKDLDTCTHVFIRCDHVKAPLEPLYMGPYSVIDSISDRLFKIHVDGREKNISVDRLKPVHFAYEDITTPSLQISQDCPPPPPDQPKLQRIVKFQNSSSTSSNFTGRGVDVAPSTPPMSSDERHYLPADSSAW